MLEPFTRIQCLNKKHFSHNLASSHAEISDDKFPGIDDMLQVLNTELLEILFINVQFIMGHRWMP